VYNNELDLSKLLIIRKVFKVILVGCSLCVLGGACQPKQNNTIATRAKNDKLSPTENLEARLADSLRKYRHLTDFWQAGDSGRYALFGKTLNDRQIGVAAVSDSVLLLFQEQNHQYKLVARGRFPDDATDCEVTDLNGDDKEDIIVYGFGNMHGQRRPYVFLSDSTGLVHYRPDLALYNITYSRRTKSLISYYVGGANSVHSKEVYRWQGDSARLVAGAEYDMYSGRVELYRMCGGRKCYRKLYPVAAADTARRSRNEAIYDTALFAIEDFP
jgi:hypothetical protein